MFLNVFPRVSLLTFWNLNSTYTVEDNLHMNIRNKKPTTIIGRALEQGEERFRSILEVFFSLLQHTKQWSFRQQVPV